MSWNGQFCPIDKFSNLYPPKQLIITQNSQFCPIHKLSNLFPLKQLRINQNDQFSSICKFSNLFPLKLLMCNFSNLSPLKWFRMTQNSQFHLIHNFSHLLPPKHLIFGEISKIFVPGVEGYISKLFEFFNIFELLHTEVAQNDSQWPILPLKWLRLAQMGNFG